MKSMSALYLICLSAVAFAIVALLVESICEVRVLRRWPATRQLLVAVPSADRRSQTLPFVGEDRRGALNAIDSVLAFAEARRAA